MATFSIVSQPQDLTTAYNEVYFTLISDLRTKDNFLYNVNVNANGELASKLNIVTNPNGYGEFDIQRILKQFIDSNFQPNALIPFRSRESLVKYDLDFSVKFRDTFRFEDNFVSPGNQLAFWGMTESYFKPGDDIYVSQDVGYVHIDYEGHSVVTEAGWSASGVWGSDGYYVMTSTSFQGNAPANPGSIVLDNAELFNIENVGSVDDKFVFNGRIDWDSFIDTDFTDYIMGTSSGKFMSNVPNGYNLNDGDRMFLLAYSDNDSDMRYLNIETDNGRFVMTNPYYKASTEDKDKLISFPVGPHCLNNGVWSVLSGSLPILDDSIKEYSVYLSSTLGGGDSNRSSEIKTFSYNQSNCSLYETVQIIFLDKLGSYIPFDFTLRNTENVNITRKEYTKNYGGYSPTKSGYHYNTHDRGNKQLGNVYDTTYKLRSDYINQDTYDFLAEMIYSPDVYMLKDGKMYGVILTTNSYEMKKRIDGLLRIDIDVKMAHKNYTQD